MAKIGEGDPRWLVEDKGAAGTNVNNWHWVEKDAVPWSKTRLQELFADKPLLSEGGKELRTTGLASLTGEAVVNNRKNKVIPAYELAVTLGWAGSVDGEEAKGKITLPYVSDEADTDEVPEIQFGFEADTKASRELKEAFLKGPAKKALVSTIHTFVAELRAGGPATVSGTAKAAAAAPSATAAASSRTKLTSARPEEVQAGASGADTKKAGKGGAKDLELTEKFYARASDLFECFSVEGKLMAFTQSKATIEARPKGKLVWFSGAVQGEVTEVEKDAKLAMKWRFSSWEDGCFSNVLLTFEEPEPGTTMVTLKQTGIPERDRAGNEGVFDTTQKGWKQNIFARIRQVFGYGA